MREADRVGRRDAAVALGARARSAAALLALVRGGAGLRVLLIMDPFIKVPPDHYGGIERVVADLADRLTQLGHDVTLWAAPGSRVNGTVEPFGREGEWTRWSNIRNTLTLAGRFLRGRDAST